MYPRCYVRVAAAHLEIFFIIPSKLPRLQQLSSPPSSSCWQSQSAVCLLSLNMCILWMWSCHMVFLCQTYFTEHHVCKVCLTLWLIVTISFLVVFMCLPFCNSSLPPLVMATASLKWHACSYPEAWGLPERWRHIYFHKYGHLDLSTKFQVTEGEL